MGVVSPSAYRAHQSFFGCYYYVCVFFSRVSHFLSVSFFSESQISGKMLEESIQTSIKTYAKQYAGQTNRQVYKHAFHDLVMKPHPEGGDFAFFGNTQRAQFADALKKIVASIPSGAHIWDVGAGAGDVVPLFSGLDNVTMHLEEPNQHLLETYKGAVEAASNLTLGKVYQGPLQDFYEQPSKVEQYVPPPVNLVLAIHMIYFLNDYTKDDIAPLESLKAAMGCLYQRLQKGGRIFIVYAGPNNYAIPITLHYFKTHQPDKPYSKNLEAILAAWKELFEDSGLVGHLNQLCPDDAASVKAEHLPCHFFAKDKLDLAAMGAITNLIPSDDEPFDVMRMESCCEWVEKHGAECGLAIEEGDVPQKGCWKINVNQVVVEITKQ